MATLEEIRQAIGILPRFQREDLAEWILSSPDFDDRVAEAVEAYAQRTDRRMTIEEYLQMDQESVRYEYIAGEIFAMSNPTLRHEVIAGNIFSAVHAQVRGGPCRAFSSHAKVFLKVGQDGIFYMPDAMVACGELSDESLERQFLSDPRLVVEVLSPSTETTDRREKRLNYQHIATLEEYVLVAQRLPRVTIYRRSEDWIPRGMSSLDSVAEFCSIGLHLELERIYEGTGLGARS